MSLFKLTFEIKILQQNPDSVGFKSGIGIRAARPDAIFFHPGSGWVRFFQARMPAPGSNYGFESSCRKICKPIKTCESWSALLRRYWKCSQPMSPTKGGQWDKNSARFILVSWDPSNPSRVTWAKIENSRRTHSTHWETLK